MKRILLFTLAALFLCIRPAQAIVMGVSVSPASYNVAMGSGSTVTLTWQITRTAAGAPFTVQSDQGHFVISDSDTGAATPAISRTFSTNQTVVTLVETVTVPQSIMNKALTAGGSFSFSHMFTDNNFATSITGSVSLHVTGGGGIEGPLSIQSLALTFDDGSINTTRNKGQSLTASAVVNVSGTGLFDAFWEVSTAGDSSANFYRPLREITQTLTGQNVIQFFSPTLPTSDVGSYNLRLRVISPATGFPPPTLLYFITGQKSNAELPVVHVTGPEDNASVSSKTVFSWQGTKGAAGYKLEIFDSADNATPVAKMMVRAKKLSAHLSALTLSELTSPGVYQWHVIAFDRNGRDIASSKRHTIHINK